MAKFDNYVLAESEVRPQSRWRSSIIVFWSSLTYTAKFNNHDLVESEVRPQFHKAKFNNYTSESEVHPQPKPSTSDYFFMSQKRTIHITPN
jgi:hypothetical protein